MTPIINNIFRMHVTQFIHYYTYTTYVLLSTLYVQSIYL